MREPLLRGTTIAAAIATALVLVCATTFSTISAASLGAPRNLTATRTTLGIVLYWQDDANSTESGFLIERKTTSIPWAQIRTVGVNSASYNNNVFTDTGVTSTDFYSYRIRAYAKSLQSPYSNEATEASLQVSDGFDYPVGDSEGQGAYAGCTTLINGSYWYVAADVMGYKDHTGEDWNGSCYGNTDFGQPVYAAASGRVVFAGYVPGGTWGNTIVIAHRLPDDSFVYTQYAHLDQIHVSPGAIVWRRDSIGNIGCGANDYYCDTAQGRGSHLHFEVRKLAVSSGNWPGDTLIPDQYYDPSDRSGDTWTTRPGAIEGFRPEIANLQIDATTVQALKGTLTFVGFNYTPNDVVRRFVLLPGASGYSELSTVRADNAGVVRWTLTPPCSQVGVTKELILDRSTWIPGDYNADGIVNSVDWSIINAKWFQYDDFIDLTGDHFVNSLDFSVLNSNWLKSQKPRVSRTVSFTVTKSKGC